MNRWERIISAGSFSFLVGAGLLVWSVYRDASAGLSVGNVARCLVAGALVALAVKGIRLRHAAGR
jgi:hypothetical protein